MKGTFKMTSITINVELTAFKLRELSRSLSRIADGLEPVAVAPVAVAPVADPATIFGGKPAESVEVPESPSATVSTVLPAPGPVVIEGKAPVPPVVAPADIATTSMTTGTAPTVALDSEGLPWDGRIHASSKQFLVKGGGWKKKRGVDDETVATVEAELRQALAAGKPVLTDAGAPLPPDTSLSAPSASAPLAAAPATPAATEQIAPTATAPGSISTFPDLMREITSKGIDPETINAVVASFGLPNMVTLVSRPDLIPQFAAALGL